METPIRGTSARQRLRALDRRVRWAVFFEATVRALLIGALAIGTVVVVARVAAGAHWPPRWSWLVVLGTVATIHGLRMASRRAMSEQGLAAWLDRRHRLGGLLVSAVEIQDGSPSEWDDALTRRLEDADHGLPRFRVGRWIGRVAAVAAFAGVLVWLPAPAGSRDGRRDTLVAEQLERIAEDVELALEAGAIGEEEAVELRDRLDEMEQRLDEGLDVAWSDVDGLDDRLEHEESVRIDRLATLRAELGEYQATKDTAGEAAQRDLLDALAQAEALGLDAHLDDELGAMAEKLAAAAAAADRDAVDGAASSALDLADLGLDAAGLERLAAALEGATDMRLEDLEAAGRIDPSELKELSEILSEAREGC